MMQCTVPHLVSSLLLSSPPALRVFCSTLETSKFQVDCDDYRLTAAAAAAAAAAVSDGIMTMMRAPRLKSAKKKFKN